MKKEREVTPDALGGQDPNVEKSKALNKAVEQAPDWSSTKTLLEDARASNVPVSLHCFEIFAVRLGASGDEVTLKREFDWMLGILSPDEFKNAKQRASFGLMLSIFMLVRNQPDDSKNALHIITELVNSTTKIHVENKFLMALILLAYFPNNPLYQIVSNTLPPSKKSKLSQYARDAKAALKAELQKTVTGGPGISSIYGKSDLRPVDRTAARVVKKDHKE